jgi:hypothetical protein
MSSCLFLVKWIHSYEMRRVTSGEFMDKTLKALPSSSPRGFIIKLNNDLKVLSIEDLLLVISSISKDMEKVSHYEGTSICGGN